MRLPGDRNHAKLLVPLFALGTLYLTGCAVINSAATASTGSSGNSTDSLIYARGINQNNILAFSETTSATAPAQTLTLPPTFLSETVAADSSGQIYVGAVNRPAVQQEVLIYPANSTGTATPSRTLLLTTADYPWVLAIDGAGLLYVGTQEEGTIRPVINVFSATASSADLPIRTIELSNAGDIEDMAVDAAGNIYVAGSFYVGSAPLQQNAVEIFAAGATIPTRTITWGAEIYGVAVDTAGDIYINSHVVSPGAPAIQEFAPGSNGAATPINTIILPALPANMMEAESVQSMRISKAGNLYAGQILVSTPPTSPSASFAIYGYNPSATGAAAPMVQITPTAAISTPFTAN